MNDPVKAVLATHPGGLAMIEEAKRAVLKLTADMRLGDAEIDAIDAFYSDLQLFAMALELQNGHDHVARDLAAGRWARTWSTLQRTFS